MSKQTDMSLVEHLTELRKRIILIVVVFVLTLIFGFIMAEPVMVYLNSKPPLSQLEWNAFSPWDALRIYMMFALMISLAISLPFILYQIWSFMKPGLHEHEQKAVFRYIPIAVVMFLVGATFAYFIVFPMAVRFTSFFTNKLQLIETYGIVQYFSFMFNIIFPMSLLFQLPVVVMFLSEIRIISPRLLTKFRKPAYMILVVLSTLVTPPDFISPILVSIPLILLYEGSIWVARRIFRKHELREQILSDQVS